jgi:hypothetical protein
MLKIDMDELFGENRARNCSDNWYSPGHTDVCLRMP